MRVIKLLILLSSSLLLFGCSGDAASLGGLLNQNNGLYVPDLLAKAQEYNGKDVTVNGTYIGRAGNPGTTVLALGVSTLDNGLDAQPLGDQIWLEGFPEPAVKDLLHQPGDAVYGFVRVSGQFEAAGAYGPQNAYKYRIQVKDAEPIEQVRRKEVRIPDEQLGDGKVSFQTLSSDAGKYNNQAVTTRGYYFWNGAIYVLAEGVSTEEDGSSPQPIGKQIWMEGFPPDATAILHIGPNNSYVWGYVEVNGNFQSGGKFGRDGAYSELLTVNSATALEQK